MLGKFYPLFYSMGIGVYLVFVYDAFRTFRRVFSHNLFWVSVEDLLFWSYTTMVVFLVLQEKFGGTLRFFFVFFAFLGMLLYKKTLGDCLVNLSAKWLIGVKSLIKRVLSPLFRVGSFVKKKLTQGAKLLKITLNKRE